MVLTISLGIEMMRSVSDLCEYCELHEGEKDGYCSDSCRRSMQLFRAAQDVVAMFSREYAPPAVRRLAKSLDQLN